MVDTLVTNVSISALPKFRRGVTALTVLLALDRAESYGYEIRRDAYRRTKGLFRRAIGHYAKESISIAPQ